MDGPDPSANPETSAIWPELWAAFAPHRIRITGMLQEAAVAKPCTLSVWGAGRTTDLDLIELINHFSRIDLVDLDSAITEKALLQRGFENHQQVNARGGVDLCGLNSDWDLFCRSPDENRLHEMIEKCAHFQLDLGTYDVLVSTCLLSQILIKAVDSIQSSNLEESIQANLLPRMLRAIREKHVELMLAHTRPGGTALLVTDLTSAEALPEILQKEADLNQLLSNEVAGGNHFHGMNPHLIYQLGQIPAIANQLAQMQVSPPWVWNSIESQYLCVAIRLQKKQS